MNVVAVTGRSSVVGRRYLSRGALPGGFTKEGLQNYAIHHWNEQDIGRRRRRRAATIDDDSDDDDNKPYTDLFSHKVSAECKTWLDLNDDPAGALGNAYFGSIRFIPERMILSPMVMLMNNGSRDRLEIPPSFVVDDTFLVWKVIMKAPHELICEWKFQMDDADKYTTDTNPSHIITVKGLTMLAFDPQLQRIYNGNSFSINGIDLDFKAETKSKIMEMGISFHRHYAKFLLGGMTNILEDQAKASSGK